MAYRVEIAIDNSIAPAPRGPPPIEGVQLNQLRELIQTEVSYLKDLDTLCDTFLLPLRELRVLQREDERAIFSNCETLRGIHQTLCRDLLTPTGKTVAGTAAAFQKLSPFFKACECSTPRYAAARTRLLSGERLPMRRRPRRALPSLSDASAHSSPAVTHACTCVRMHGCARGARRDMPQMLECAWSCVRRVSRAPRLARAASRAR